jgi:hypothetical protein
LLYQRTKIFLGILGEGNAGVYMPKRLIDSQIQRVGKFLRISIAYAVVKARY